jgi:2-octaprenyl-6-methoxyphenol hydroxylase
LDDEAWLARIQKIVGWRVGRLLASGARSAYPIVRVVAQRVFAERAVLLGNAAQTIHPIGAQGFNLGLRDALTLAEAIQQADDPGDGVLLSGYAARRAEDRQRTLEFSDGLARLTANPATLLRPLRSLGLLAAGASPSLQSWLVGGAMGFRGDVPALCRERAG